MGKVRVWLIVGALLVAGAPALSSASGSGGGSGSISGTVTDAVGAPLAGVCAYAYGADDEDWGYWYQEMAVTRPDGTYMIEYLYEGPYKVRFEDCSGDPVYLSEWFDDATDFDSATAIEVTAYADTPGIDAALALGGSISGVALTTGGAGIGGLCVRALEVGSEWWEFTDYTSSDGTYRVGALPTGTYKVEFGCTSGSVPFEPQGASPASHTPDAEAFVPEWYDDAMFEEDATPVSVVAGIETPGIDATLVEGGSITGSVTSLTGDPIAWACVDVAHVDGHTSRYGYADDGGGYLVQGLRAGEHKVYAYDCDSWTYEGEWYLDKRSVHLADPVAVVLGERTGGIDFTLAPRPVPDVAVLDLAVENAAIRTEVGSVPGPGYNRTVHLSLGNIGTARAWSAQYIVWVEMVNGGAPKLLADDWIDLDAGQVVNRALRWNALGSVGDATIHAAVCHWDDRHPSNDTAQLDHYVLVGGTGFGTTLDRNGYRPYCWSRYYYDDE